jgi:hypothetical protein
MTSDMQNYVEIMTDELGLTPEQKQGFNEYIETVDHLIQCTCGRLEENISPSGVPIVLVLMHSCLEMNSPNVLQTNYLHDG